MVLPGVRLFQFDEMEGHADPFRWQSVEYVLTVGEWRVVLRKSRRKESRRFRVPGAVEIVGALGSPSPGSALDLIFRYKTHIHRYGQRSDGPNACRRTNSL